MSTTIKTGWLKDKSENKFAPKTLTSQVQTADGILLDTIIDTINSNTNTKMDTINPTGTGSFSLNRLADSTVGNYSFAEGTDTTASSYASHAEGVCTISSSSASHAEGYETTASGSFSHAEGQQAVASGLYGAHAEGAHTEASGDYGAHAEGRQTVSSGAYASHAEGGFTTASGTYSHAEGYQTTASGGSNRWGAHAEGHGTTASNTGAHAEGQSTIASGQAAHAEGSGTAATEFTSHAEGCQTLSYGDSSHAEGMRTVAYGEYSHAEGYGSDTIVLTGEANATQYTYGNYTVMMLSTGILLKYKDKIAEITSLSSNKTLTLSETLSTDTALSSTTVIICTSIAKGNYSHTEGGNTQANGDYSHAEGYKTTTLGAGSHAEGYGTAANGNYSHTEGMLSTATGEAAHAAGYGTTALNHQYVIGHYNRSGTAGNSSGTTGDAFIIGKGTSSSKANAFRVTYAGKPYALSSMNTSGADYAEFFEWLDTNPNNEDRRGYFVTLDGDKIKIAEPGDYILGIISALPAVVGNSDENWRGRYILDEFGGFITEEFEYEEKILDKDTGKIRTITKTGTRYKENPEYNPTLSYIQREDRPEWDTVGMIGVLAVRDDGTCQVNGYCQVSDGGIATASENGYRVIKRVNENVVKVVFR